MRVLGFEDIILVIILKYTGESAIVSSRRYPRLFLQIGLKFTSDTENFLVKMYTLSSLVLFRPHGRGAKVGNK